MSLSEYERGYISGIIDGEGSIFIYKRKTRQYCLMLAVTNTNRELLEEIKFLIGGQIQTVKRRGNHKTCYILQVHSNGLRRLLPNIRLLVKEEQRLLALYMLELLEAGMHRGVKHRSQEEELEYGYVYQEMKKLNGTFKV